MGNTALGHVFDATTVDPASRPPALPTGWYNVMITQGEIKPTKNNDGGYAELGMKVLDGPHAGRMLFDRLNLWNNNPVAVEIAQKTLSAICHATGVFQVSDLQQLFGKPLMARAMYKPAEGQYDEGNDVKGYAKTGEKQTAEGGAAPVPGAPAPASAPGNGPTFSPSWGTPAPGAQPAAQPAPTPAPAPAPAAQPDPAQPWQRPPAGTPAPAAAAPAGGAAPVTPPWARQG